MGTILGFAMPYFSGEHWDKWVIMVMPPGAFFTLACMIWLCRSIKIQGGEIMSGLGSEMWLALVTCFAAIFTQNILLTTFLGMCPFTSVSREVKTAAGLGGAVCVCHDVYDGTELVGI